MEKNINLKDYLDRIFAGKILTEQDIYVLSEHADSQDLRSAAKTVTKAFVKPVFDSCSIVNARSGKCSENCKWCAQSAHYNTGCHTYAVIDSAECMKVAQHNAAKGVKRFSLVASGRAVTGEALTEMCDMLRKIKEETGIFTCASMGLLNREQLQKLWDAGVRRYHCNLETAPSHFEKMCTTHTIEDKLETIAAAQDIGFEICSGGIIGMGETKKQRAEFALTLRRARPHSIPVNILCRISGTPLENIAPISADDVLDFIALLRLTHPHTEIRFAGGRHLMSRDNQIEAMHIGANGGITGDLLTTIGSTINRDRDLAADAGYQF